MTEPAFLLQSERSRYAAAAAHERDERARLYPQRIRDKKISSDEAHADWWAWIAIAQWCAGERMPQFGIDVEWPDLLGAAQRALEACRTALAKAPADPERRARHDAVAGLYELLSGLHRFLEDLHRTARAGSAEKAAA